MAAKIVGNTDVFKGPNASDDSTGNVRRLTAEWHGPYALLSSSKPDIGEPYLDTGCYVTQARVVRDECGYGTLFVTAEAVATKSIIGYVRETLETEQMLIERPLLDHPTLTAEEGKMALNITRWKDEEDADLRAAWDYIAVDGVKRRLTDTEIHWAKKLLRGVDTFKDYVPVIRRRRAYNGRPTTSACGIITDPPFTVNGVTSYLMTADNAVEDENGNWTRIEEWTGATGAWDPDIYPSSRATPRRAKTQGRGKK